MTNMYGYLTGEQARKLDEAWNRKYIAEGRILPTTTVKPEKEKKVGRKS